MAAVGGEQGDGVVGVLRWVFSEAPDERDVKRVKYLIDGLRDFDVAELSDYLGPRTFLVLGIFDEQKSQELINLAMKFGLSFELDDSQYSPDYVRRVLAGLENDQGANGSCWFELLFLPSLSPEALIQVIEKADGSFIRLTSLLTQIEISRFHPLANTGLDCCAAQERRVSEEQKLDQRLVQKLRHKASVFMAEPSFVREKYAVADGVLLEIDVILGGRHIRRELHSPEREEQPATCDLIDGVLGFCMKALKTGDAQTIINQLIAATK